MTPAFVKKHGHLYFRCLKMHATVKVATCDTFHKSAASSYPSFCNVRRATCLGCRQYATLKPSDLLAEYDPHKYSYEHLNDRPLIRR